MPLKIIAKHSHACMYRPLFWGDPHSGFNSPFPWRSCSSPPLCEWARDDPPLASPAPPETPAPERGRVSASLPARDGHYEGLCLLAPFCGLSEQGERSYSTLPTGVKADTQLLSRFPWYGGAAEAPHGGGHKGGGTGPAPRRVPAARKGGRAGAGPGRSGRLVRSWSSAAPLPGAAPGGAGGTCRPRPGPSRPSRPVLKAAAAGTAPARALTVSPHRTWPWRACGPCWGTAPSPSSSSRRCCCCRYPSLCPRG